MIIDTRKENSREARLKAQHSMSGHKLRIYKALLIAPGTAKDICFRDCELDYHAVQRRLSEMVRDGKIELAGKKDGMQVYKIKT